MNRRELLAAVAAISLAPGARALAQTGDLKTAARDAWLFALPLIEMANNQASRAAVFRSRAPWLNRAI